MCILDLRKLVELLDIPALHHPIRTMFARTLLYHVDELRTLLAQNEPDAPQKMLRFGR